MNLLITYLKILLFLCCLPSNVLGIEESKRSQGANKLQDNKYLYLNIGRIGIEEDYFGLKAKTSAFTYTGIGFNHVFHRINKNLFSYGFSATFSGDSEGFSTGMSYYSRAFWHRVISRRWVSKLGVFYRQLPLVSNGTGVKESSSFDLFGPEYGLTYFAVVKGNFLPISLNVMHGMIGTRDYELGTSVATLKGITLKLSTQVKFKKEWSLNLALEKVMLSAGNDVSVDGMVTNLGIGHHF